MSVSRHSLNEQGFYVGPTTGHFSHPGRIVQVVEGSPRGYSFKCNDCPNHRAIKIRAGEFVRKLSEVYLK